MRLILSVGACLLAAILSIGACLLGGCTVVYDNQYDDRAAELEEFRTEVFTVDDDVRLLATGGDRLYWVDHVRPGDENVLHSVKPPLAVPVGGETDYAWSAGDGDTTILDYHFSRQMIVQCSTSAKAYDEGTGADLPRGDTGNGGDTCEVDGTTVYFLIGNRLDRWVPNGPKPTPTEPDLPVAIDFATIPEITGGIDLFRVIDNTVVAVESGGDIYTIDLTTKEAVWLENEFPVIGNVFFDDKGVLFETNGEGARYIQFAGKVETTLASMVADGGYHLSFKHGDIQVPAGDSEFVIQGRHLIYRGQRGIFAYGLDTHNVVDLLLDRGEGIDLEISYHRPVVTANGFMFVESTAGFSDGPVYQVDLNGRLR